MYWQSAWSRSRSKLGEMGDRVRADAPQICVSRVLPCPYPPTDQRRGAQSATSPWAGIPQRIPPSGAPQGLGQASVPSRRPEPSRGEDEGSPLGSQSPSAAWGSSGAEGAQAERRPARHFANTVVNGGPPNVGHAQLGTPTSAPWGAVTLRRTRGGRNTCCPSALCRRSEG